MKVLVLVLKGLHCGPIGAYGNDGVGTLAIDRLAAEGVVFDQHYADAPDPAAARQSWLTGRYHLPTTHPAPAAPVATDLLESFRAAEVFTALVAETEPPAKFADAWDGVDIVTPPADEPALEAVLGAVNEALDELAEVDSWLLWVEFDTCVPPWRFPEEFFADVPAAEEDDAEAADDDEDDEDDAEVEDEADDEQAGDEADELLPLTDPQPGPLGDDPDDDTFLRLQETYAAAVRYVDAGIEHLLEGLEDDVTVVVTSDRGTVLGEHGMIGVPRPWLHEELLHVPLVVREPNRASAGRRVAALTQSLDLLPTLLDLFGIAIPPEVHGRSLVPLLRGDDTPVRDYACSGLQVGLAIEWALRTPEAAFLLPLQGEIEDAARPPQMYAKPEDRWEVNDVSQHHLELCDHFGQVLKAFAEAARQPGPLAAPELRDVEGRT